MLCRTALLGLACWLVAAAPAAGAAPWSDPVVVPGSERPAATRPALALGTQGTGLLGWSASADPQNPDGAVAGRLSPVTADGAPGAEQSLDPYDLAAPPVLYGGTRGLLLQSRGTRLAVASVRVDGLQGARQTLDREVELGGADLAANARGDAVAAWIERRRPAGTDRLWAAVRRGSGAFGVPQVLAGSGELGAVDATVGPRGDAVVAYERRSGGVRRIQARVRRPQGGFGSPDALGTSAGAARLASGISARGRVYVAWSTQDEADPPRRAWRVHAATQPAGARRFGRAQKLDAGTEALRPPGRVALAVAGDQSATVAWSAAVRDGTGVVTNPVRTATTDRRGTFGPQAAVAEAFGGVGALVTAPSGATTLLFTGAGDAPLVVASTRSAGAAAFGPLEPVSAAPAAPAAAPSLAVDPRDGRLAAAWVGGGATGVLTSTRPPG